MRQLKGVSPSKKDIHNFDYYSEKASHVIIDAGEKERKKRNKAFFLEMKRQVKDTVHA